MEYTKEQLERLRQIELDLYHRLKRLCEKHGLRFVTGFGTTLGAVRHQGFIPWDDDMDFLMPRADYEKLVEIANRELEDEYVLLEPRTTKNYVMAFAKLARRDSTFIEEEDTYIKYHSGIFIDIFPMDYWPQDKKKRDRIAFRCYVLARLASLATYSKPKLPKKMGKAKRYVSRAGCMLISGFLKLFRITTPKIYREYLRLAMLTSPEEGGRFVTDMCWCWPRRDGMIGLQFPEEELFDPVYVKFENTAVPVPVRWDRYLATVYRDYMTLPAEEDRHCHRPAVLVFPEEEQMTPG